MNVVIKYFGESGHDINDTNTIKTSTILKNKILQIDGYFNERGTVFRNYLFGLLNNVRGEINENTNINEITIENRSSLNIFLFGNPRAGKSRFINLSMNEMVSRERYSTAHTSKKFTEFQLPMEANMNDELGQIVLYDSPGLKEDEEIIKGFKSLVDKKLNYFTLRKEAVPILLMFIKHEDGIGEKTYNFIGDLNKKQFYIFFIITHSKRGHSERYRTNLIHQLKVRNILDGKNLEILNNYGQNIINVNLKADEEYGEFYGFNEIYNEIYKLFPSKFNDDIEEALNLNLDRLLGFLRYKDYFFLKSCNKKEDFISRVTAKIDDMINISSSFAAFSGLIPIPFADIPVVIGLEVELIKYMTKIYEINPEEINIPKLLVIGPTDTIMNIVSSSLSQILKLVSILDIIPVVGQVASFASNFGIIKIYGNALKNYFYAKLIDEKTLSIIKSIIKDYRVIYQKLDEFRNKKDFNIC